MNLLKARILVLPALLLTVGCGKKASSNADSEGGSAKGSLKITFPKLPEQADPNTLNIYLSIALKPESSASTPDFNLQQDANRVALIEDRKVGSYDLSVKLIDDTNDSTLETKEEKIKIEDGKTTSISMDISIP